MNLIWSDGRHGSMIRVVRTIMTSDVRECCVLTTRPRATTTTGLGATGRFFYVSIIPRCTFTPSLGLLSPWNRIILVSLFNFPGSSSRVFNIVEGYKLWRFILIPWQSSCCDFELPLLRLLLTFPCWFHIIRAIVVRAWIISRDVNFVLFIYTKIISISLVERVCCYWHVR